MRSVEAEEGRGAGVEKKGCPMISASSSSSSSCVRVTIVLSTAAAWAVFVVVVVRGANLAAVPVRGWRGRRRAAPYVCVPSPRPAPP